MKISERHGAQRGATLIEVLVAILVLAFGMLALGGMMAYGVQMPKLAGHRATAANLAASHVERMRANPAGFHNGNYATASSYDGTFNAIAAADCVYPNCTFTTLADMDVAATQRAVRAELPAGGMLTTCSPAPCAIGSYGNVWIIWQEPATNAALTAGSTDSCPAAVTSTYTDPAPRCLYVRFKP
jgi:type IV pilus assembly protein PilV